MHACVTLCATCVAVPLELAFELTAGHHSGLPSLVLFEQVADPFYVLQVAKLIHDAVCA